MNQPNKIIPRGIDSIDYMLLTFKAERLCFPKEIEREFTDDYYYKNKSAALKALVMGVILYSLFGLLDIYAAPLSFKNLLLIRFCFGLPGLLIAMLVALSRKWPAIMQLLFSLATTLASVAIVLMIGVTQPQELAYTHYYTGIILVMIFTCSGGRLRFWYALSANTVTMVTYEVVAIYKQDLLASSEGQLTFFVQNFFLLGANFISLFGCYTAEVYSRIDFLQRRTIESEKNKSYALVKEIETKNSVIRRHQAEMQLVKMANIQAEFAKKLSGLKLKSLRDQMNPHFLFNCMNTIEAYIIENRSEEATQFLQKFSKLIRASLENSQHETILITKDLEALELYIQLEEVRANHRFSHSIKIEETLLKEAYTIPPLLIQPYVENAILHGLRHKGGEKGLLQVFLNIQEEQLICTVEDNGVGRQRAAELQSARPGKSQSLGMKFTGERMDVLNKIYSTHYKVVITDINTNGQTGTKVELSLPLVKQT